MKNTPKQNRWQLQQAKAHFSVVIEKALTTGLQFITKQGRDVAVILSKEEYERYAQPKESLIDFFKKSPYPEHDLETQGDKEDARAIEL